MASLRALLLLLLLAAVVGAQEKIRDQEVARSWLEAYNQEAMQVYYKSTEASWNYNTNLTDHNQRLSTEASVAKSLFLQRVARNTTRFDWRNFNDSDIKRQFSKLAIANTANLPEEKVTKVDNLRSSMQKTYSTGKVCNKPKDSTNKCYSLEPDLTRILAKSRDADELLWAWKGWRDATGKKMRKQYEEFVNLQNEAAKTDGFSDQGAYWRSWYEMEGFDKEMERLWLQVKPMYQQLHAYTRRKLMEAYKGKDFPKTRHIPAHLLGNMWAQSWGNIESLLRPFPNKAAIDVTAKLVEQGYTAKRMFNLSEEFFTSLGLLPMPPEFWAKSMLVKPDDREVVCHASAWDFYNQKDFRIKQCTDVTSSYLRITHHEMGHIQYYLQYRHLPVVFRRGANPGLSSALT